MLWGFKYPHVTTRWRHRHRKRVFGIAWDWNEHRSFGWQFDSGDWRIFDLWLSIGRFTINISLRHTLPFGWR